MANEREYSIFFDKKVPPYTSMVTCSCYDDKQLMVKMLKTIRKEHPEYGIKDIIVNTYIGKTRELLTQEIIH